MFVINFLCFGIGNQIKFFCSDEEMGDGWRRVGVLTTDVHAFYLGATEVVFWLNEAAVPDPDAYLAMLRDWAGGLPDGARFSFADAPEEEPAA